MKKVLITGAAGFIGYHLSVKLSKEGVDIVGIDNVNEYYDVRLKLDRIEKLKECNNVQFIKMSITDKQALDSLFSTNSFDIVINLAAQAGVRYSIEKPYEYIDANLIGFINVLEACRHYPVEHLIYASSSSVYGSNKEIPFKEEHRTDHPVSLYAATKKANEVMAHSYSSLYKIPCTGLRFFTVYGAWGRPDMAYYKFANAISSGQSIDVYNNGDMRRDFTFIDDITESIFRLIGQPPPAKMANNGNEARAVVPYAIYNIGNNSPERLLDFIELLEELLEKKAIKNFLPMQAGDVEETYADIDNLSHLIGFSPNTSLENGLRSFVDWYRSYKK